MFIDAHCHLDRLQDSDLRTVLRAAAEARVEKAVSCSTNVLSIGMHLDIARDFEAVSVCLGIHPVDALSMPSAELESGKRLVEENVSAASGIGEVGLDFLHAKTMEQKKLQIETFAFFVRLAEKNRKPVAVHSRNSDNECLELLEKEKCKKVLLHWCTNSAETVQTASSRGHFMSAGPAIISGKGAAAIAKRIPLELLLLETDAPVRFSGRQSSPSWIPLVAQKIAELHNVSVSRVEDATTANAKRLFGMKKD